MVKKSGAKAKSQRDPKSSTRDALERLDRVFHERARLGIMTTLIGFPDGANFNELKDHCDLTDGNLNRHLKVLVDEGFLKVRKTGRGRTTNSHYRLTPKGSREFKSYLAALEVILNAAKQQEPQAKPTPVRSSSGLNPAF